MGSDWKRGRCARDRHTAINGNWIKSKPLLPVSAWDPVFFSTLQPPIYSSAPCLLPSPKTYEKICTSCCGPTPKQPLWPRLPDSHRPGCVFGWLYGPVGAPHQSIGCGAGPGPEVVLALRGMGRALPRAGNPRLTRHARGGVR